jgi:hypothetical protein
VIDQPWQDDRPLLTCDRDVPYISGQ